MFYDYCDFCERCMIMYERFMQLLQENSVTPYRVSKETGVTQTTLSDWKTGRATPKTATLQKIADYFNVSLDWLAGSSECRDRVENINTEDIPEEIVILNRAAKKMTPAQRQKLLEVARVMFKEEFDD